jgi:N-acetylglucosaminyldiphosphoundecaprenol N-acetyl-beta-D-mannosaminyltransferase
MSRSTAPILALNLDLVSYEEALKRIVGWARNKESHFVCFANVHMVIEAYRHPDFADQVNRASLVVTDGVPLMGWLRAISGIKQERIAGMDALPDLLKLASQNRLKVYFFGTTLDVLDRIREKINALYPDVTIAGMFSPPFGQSLDDDTYIAQINASGADLVFVALGCPKQEKWMATHTAKIHAPLLGVGGAFPVFAGMAKRAPKLMQRFGLEWLFRLFQEPRRLFARYLVTNSLFLALAFREKIRVLGSRGSKT